MGPTSKHVICLYLIYTLYTYPEGHFIFPWGTLNTPCVVYPRFDCDLSHEVRCEIFHSQYHVSTQKFLKFGAFWISDFQVKDAQPVYNSASRCVA